MIGFLPARPVVACSTTGRAGRFLLPPCNQDCDEIAFENASVCPLGGMALIQSTATERKKVMEKMNLHGGFYLQTNIVELDLPTLLIYERSNESIAPVVEPAIPASSAGL